MDVLNQIIEKLSKEEIRNFKVLSAATVRPEERKDLLLFDYMRTSGVKFNEDKAVKKLDYTTGDKNSYYRIKHRLMENLGDSLVLLHTHKNELYELLQYIQLFYICHSRNIFKACSVYLRKAERLANAIENYEMLDIVYSNFIRLSADLAEIKPADYIAKREKNAVIVTNLRDMEDILATLSHRLKVSQNFGSLDKDLLKKFQAKVKDVSKLTTAQFGKNLEARIYNALSQLFLQQHNYEALEKLVKDTYQKFDREKWFDKSNHELKLQMLTYCANALFKNGKFKESLSYAERIGEEIQMFDKLHYEKYLFFYYNALVINYSVLDRPKGLAVLNEFEQEMRSKKNTYYDFFIYLNRAVLLHDMERFKESLKNLVRLYVSPGYAEADKSFKLKIEICELIITFETGDRETLEYRLGQMKKTFASLRSEPTLKRDFEIMELLEKMNASADYKRDSAIQKKIGVLLKAKYDLKEEDSEIIKYREWLGRKLKV